MSASQAVVPNSTYEEKWVVGPHDTNFYTRTYPSSDPIAVLVFVHGAAEHAGRYTEMHTNLSTKHQIAVFVFDLRGYGRTAGDSDWHKSKDAAYGKTKWAFQMDDLEWAIEQAAVNFPALPLFLMGTSMGGGQVLGLLCDKSRADITPVKRVKGVIVGSPCITLTNPIPKPAMWIAKKVVQVKPYTLFPFRNNPEDLSRNPETNESYVSDPLIGKPGSLQSLGDMIDQGEIILKTAYANWPESIPVLLLHGTSDNVTSPKSTQELCEKLPANDKKIILYPDARHELHNEPDGVKEKSLSDVVEFIRTHSTSLKLQGL